MSKAFQAIRGMNDIVPAQVSQWQTLESCLRELTAAYGYEEIRFPVVEQLALFSRTIGDVTDIVEKEMYAFADRNGDYLALRPEGTAGCVRAAVEQGLLYNQVQKLWYMGPMFRHERPQKGRYRQFHQFAMEAFGFHGPDVDVELILWTARLWKRLGIEKHLQLQVNSLGTPELRAQHRVALVDYFQRHVSDLDEDSQRRLTTNPLRILDSKNPALAALIADAPTLLDYLDAEARDHFDTLCAGLQAAGVEFSVNPRLVRGLDYYTHTVFEWVTFDKVAQATVCGGGRYDHLVGLLGGKPTPAVGFAMGLERLLELCQSAGVSRPASMPHAYLVLEGESATAQGMVLAEQLRTAVPQLRLLTHCGGGSFKSQFKRADKSGAQVALILGPSECETNTISIKHLREDKPQQTVNLAQLVDYFLNMNLQS